MYYAKIARDTVQFMKESVQRGDAFGEALSVARANTLLFKEEDEVLLKERDDKELFDGSEVEITEEDTLEAAKRLIEEGHGEPCVLNFADPYAPGGLFLEGVTTQEERLARCTGMYWCIRDQPYYGRNVQSYSTKGGLALHDALYSPGVPVFRDLTTEERLDPTAVYPIAIITCPAPQAQLAMMKGMESELSSTMEERIRRILTIAANAKHKGVVLGAFGCGAFGNDPTMVASHFKAFVQGDFSRYFKKVIFGIRGGAGDPNYDEFCTVFGV